MASLCGSLGLQPAPGDRNHLGPGGTAEPAQKGGVDVVLFSGVGPGRDMQNCAKKKHTISHILSYISIFIYNISPNIRWFSPLALTVSCWSSRVPRRTGTPCMAFFKSCSDSVWASGAAGDMLQVTYRACCSFLPSIQQSLELNRGLLEYYLFSTNRRLYISMFLGWAANESIIGCMSL